MRLAPLLHPVGPLPSGVYWRRRAVAAAVVAALAVLLVLLARGLGGSDRLEPAPGTPSSGPASPAGSPSAAASTGTSSAGASPASVPAPSAGSGEPLAAPVATPSAATDAPPADDCGAADVRVDVAVSPVEVAAGDPVVFRVRVTGEGQPCRLDLGPVARSAQVRAGGQAVWSTEDCEAGDDSEEVLLEPGKPRELTVRWEGRRTAAGCPGGLGRAEPGEYAVAVQVGPASSPEVPFRLR